MATLAEAMTLLKYRLSNVQGTRLDDVIRLELKMAQEVLERGKVLPWFMQKWMEYTDYPVDTSFIPLPSDFIRFPDNVPVPLFISDLPATGGWNPVCKISTFEGMEARLTIQAGRPCRFSLQGPNIYLFPPPKDSCSYRLFYMGHDNFPLSDGETNGWLSNYANLLVDVAGLRVAQSARDAGAVEVFQNAITVEMELMQASEIAREVEGTRYAFFPANSPSSFVRWPDADIPD